MTVKNRAPEAPGRIAALLGRLGWVDKTFLALLAPALIAKYAFAGSPLQTALAVAAFIAAVPIVYRWLMRGLKKILWRLRYRLVAALLLTGIVPLAFVLALAVDGAKYFSGRLAAYLITTELDRRASTLLDLARGLAGTGPEERRARALWSGPYFREKYPGFEMAIDDGRLWRFPENSVTVPPPAGWGEVSGLARKDGALYLWAHAAGNPARVTIFAPVTPEMLAGVVPDLGKLALLGSHAATISGGRVLESAGRFDFTVASATPVAVAVWGAPGQFERDSLFVGTRFSAVLRTIFQHRVEWMPDVSVAFDTLLRFSMMAGLLLILELASILFGVRLTRSITRAVHNLYRGTLRVREGDFSHRIEVHGNDQLAELGDSFNRMTENLERLVEVAKEKERLQGEIEIAREVQTQLFPRALPVSKTLRLAAVCRPARLISGDYYDYLNLADSQIALAIGDVVGKGISAALLMATVQSVMRTQLRAGRALATGAGDGGRTAPLSTAALVSRLNQQLFAFTPPEKFATFCFALYDDATGLLTYTNAGHPPPILLRQGVPSRLEVTGTVAGAFESSQYGECSVRLDPGDLLVCFTDGVTEPENVFGEMFGEDRLIEAAVKNCDRGIEDIVAAIVEAVDHWTGSPELQDDMTLLIARRI
ncbi:MAG: SpoIIE family protein phosphatase [Bryobacteraceae bacterium]